MRLARVVATWFGCGLSPVAPGTVGTIGALPLWYVIRGGGPVAIGVAALVTTAIGIWASHVVAIHEGAKDPQEIVIDEVAGVFVALTAAPPTWLGTAAAVVLFRLFDITKPFPTRRFERFPGGWGIVLDDVAAGLQAALVLGALRALKILV